jgi:2'-5' RNA ligase
MDESKKNIRAFLAIEPPADILDAAGILQEKLKKEITGKISWTKPQGNHLTLKFFGNIDEDDVKNICAVVEKQVALVSPLSMKIAGTGCFPNSKKPRVLWLGTSGDIEKIATLQARLEEDFEKIGFARENRNFRPHLTLGRVKNPGDVTGVGEAINKYSDYSAGEFICKEAVLFQSKLTPRGAIYSKLKTFNFIGE